MAAVAKRVPTPIVRMQEAIAYTRTSAQHKTLSVLAFAENWTGMYTETYNLTVNADVSAPLADLAEGLICTVF